MTSPAHGAADDGRHISITHASALGHFRRVIQDAWDAPSPEAARAKRHLDFFCGHIDPVRGLRDFVPVALVASHFSALHPDVLNDAASFRSSLRIYLALLAAEVREDGAFRGANVALTFDRVRFNENMARFDQDEPAQVKIMTRQPPAGPSR